MLHRFGDFELDRRVFELRRRGAVVGVEPLVFDLLAFLCERAGEVVGRDEMVERVWKGRVVSDATVSTAIKSARRALGDDGTRQALIRTVRGRGFQLVAEVMTLDTAPHEVPGQSEAEPAAVEAPAPLHGPAGKPTIAVLPFKLLGTPGSLAGLGDAIPHELILSLGRLRWLFVIARGSSFRFRDPDPDVVEVGRALGVRYCLTGAVEVYGGRIEVAVELVETGAGALVWGDRYSGPARDVHDIRQAIARAVVTALEARIPLNEALLAERLSTEALDAWQAFHVGIKEVHQYTAEANARAAEHFAQAIRLDPSFARAHAGLSLARFQDAFLGYVSDREAAVDEARRLAERGVELDPLDPLCNFGMGRVFWLTGEIETSADWLQRATTLWPNYAHGHYALAFTETMIGRAPEPATNALLAMDLSPLDPLLYAMRGVQAMAHMAYGDGSEGARWAQQAATTPRAHHLISMIAVAAHALAGDDEQAARWAAAVREHDPVASAALFLRAFPFQAQAVRARVADALARHGF